MTSSGRDWKGSPTSKTATGPGRVEQKLQRLLEPAIESGRAPIGGVARVTQWWQENPDLRPVIEDAVVAMLAQRARRPDELRDRSTSRIVLQLAQLVAELRLDARARSVLWTLAQFGRAADLLPPSLPPDIEPKLLGWLSVIQVPEWLPMWTKLWDSAHEDLWAVAYGGLINANPSVAWARLPELLSRRGPMGRPSIAFLLYRLLQHPNDEELAVDRWTQSVAEMASLVEAVLTEQYGADVSPRVMEGLKSLRSFEGRAANSQTNSSDRSAMVLALFDAATGAEEAGDLQAARALFGEAVAAAGDGPPEVLARLHNRLGLVNRKLGNLDDADAAFSRAAELAEGAGSQEYLASLLILLAQARRARGRLDEAWAIYERSYGLYEQLGEESMQSLVLSGMAAVLARQARPADALDLWNRALDLARRSGDSEALAIATKGTAAVGRRASSFRTSPSKIELTEHEGEGLAARRSIGTLIAPRRTE